ncbi:GvpL/GvpF family gas vesicle protein [Streptacidiphilus jiangxiensis]|uniref:Gas vesicle synthesis protein GvpL/GvpF n=1 Tax=Streptacidiphilus jiangxiensis TaxID=235985 RepID=A0A1H7NUU3_STRJI|nr:GvpL/GvpF family gas vesicle protein [Streptacidiphilus jiangxiensis]SEL26765.1 Gas vesicle synthesis protein GvpL/GvpF [Streptacidiphilus jiangxiensis]
MAVYVYSITAAAHPRHLEGLTGVGEPPSVLRSVRAGPLCAVVSDAPADLRPKRRDLTAHQNVQQRLMADGTVLPLRFGLTAPDDEAVQAALDKRREEYTLKLTALEDCAEYHLKAATDQDALLRQILWETPEARRLNDEITGGNTNPDLPLALGELVAQEVQARQGALAAGIAEALRPHARQQLSSAPTGEDFLNVSFLVDQKHEQQFLAAEKGLASELGDHVDVRLYGPLPAYSFV